MKRRRLLLGGAMSPWLGAAGALAAEAPQRIDWPAMTLLQGGTLSPDSWQGQAAVVVFWATWCPYCLRHNAHVDKLHRATQDQPLRILGVAMDTDPDAVRRYMAAHHYDFPVTLDNGSLRQRVTERRVIPMTCLIDRQGRLVQAIPGEMFEDDVLDLARVLQRPAS